MNGVARPSGREPAPHGDDQRAVTGLLRLLAGGASGDELAAAALLGPLSPTRTTWVALHRLDRSRSALSLIGTCAVPIGVIGPLALLPLDAALPVTEAAMRVAPVVVPLDELTRRYPVAHPVLDSRPAGTRLLASVPALGRGAVVGTVTAEFESEPDEWWSATHLLGLVADALAVWLALVPGTGTPQPVTPTRPHFGVTARQRAVLALVAQGLTNAQIARELDYSTATVKADLSSLYRQFGVRSRTDLVSRALATAPTASPDGAAPT